MHRPQGVSPAMGFLHPKHVVHLLMCIEAHVLDWLHRQTPTVKSGPPRCRHFLGFFVYFEAFTRAPLEWHFSAQFISLLGTLILIQPFALHVSRNVEFRLHVYLPFSVTRVFPTAEACFFIHAGVHPCMFRG